MFSRPLALVRGSLLPRPADASDSVLVQDGRVRRVDRAEEVLAAAPPDVEVIDLGGRTLSPGFHDAHFHFLQSGITASHPSLRGVRSRAELFDAVRDAVAVHPGPDPLVFEAWDETTWDVPRIPTRAELDRVAPDRAVILRRIDDHTAVANRRGVERMAGVWRGPGVDTETGVLREDPVLLMEELFPPGDEEIRRAFETVSRRCFSLGITSTSDFLRPFSCRIYAERFAECSPVPRIDAYLWVDCLDDPTLQERLPAGPLRVHGIKAWADGSIGAREAALFEDYTDRPGARGTLTYSDEELRAIVLRGHQRGMAVAVHAIGDRAISQVIDAFETLPRDEIRGHRHRIEHFELPRARDIDRVARLGVRPCVQPNFVGLWAGPGGLYETALGPERLRTMNPIRTLLRRETGVFFGSDGMPASPLFGIRSAMSHPVPEERITLEEAHRLYTEEPYVALGTIDEAPRFAPGARADLTVLRVPPERIGTDTADEADLTVLAGQVVHRRVPLVDGRDR